MDTEVTEGGEWAFALFSEPFLLSQDERTERKSPKEEKRIHQRTKFLIFIAVDNPALRPDG